MDFHAPLYNYGSDAAQVRALVAADASLGALLHQRLPYIRAEVIWAAREEMCMTVEDALSRRTRALLLDAAAAIELRLDLHYIAPVLPAFFFITSPV